MKRIVLFTIAVVGLYAFLRNNVGVLPDQIILNINPDVFYKTFIPLLMVSSATCSLIKNDRTNYFYLSVFTMFIDTISRLAVLINHYYQYLTYDYIPPPIESANSIIVRTNLLPSHILLFIEIILIILIFRYISAQSSLRMHMSS